MKRKYELTNETIEFCGHTLHRIKALRSFSDVNEGEFGGFIEKQENLSQERNCWVYYNAKVYGNAVVYGNSKVYGNANVYGNAGVFDNAMVYGAAKVCGYAIIGDNAKVSGMAEVFDNAKVYGNAKIFDIAKVYGNAEVYGDAFVYDDAKVCGNAYVYGDAEICKDAVIDSDKDYIVFKNWWSSGRYFTWTRSNNMWKVGCFFGTGEELVKKAYRDSYESGIQYKRIVEYVKSIIP